MRMRKKKNLIPRMERCAACLIRDPLSMSGRWRELKPGAAELRVELGCGKGRFTAETAQAEPEVLFLAVERVPDAMVVAMERCTALGLTNVFFMDADAVRLPEFFAPGEVDRIYINFCDPWPGKRHAKRRLTHGNFLRLYRQVLKEGGQIHLKTDNAPLFEFSVEEMPQFGFALSELTRNLHEHGPQGVMTDYESKFYELGTPINRCVGTMVPWKEEAPVDCAAFRRQWLERYGSGVPKDALEAHVLSEGNFLWHLFSWNLVPALEGDAARQALDTLDYARACLFYENLSGDEAAVRPVASVPSSLFETKDDLYLTAPDLSWTYVHTHEPDCGPYFCRLPK